MAIPNTRQTLISYAKRALGHPVIEINVDGSMLEEIIPCDVPKANPKHAEMLAELISFLVAN